MSPAPFFRPEPHWVGDVIPYVHEGVFYLYYLHEQRSSPKPGTSWHLVTTEDLVHYTDRGEVLPHGEADEADFNAYTGSVVTDDEGLHHMFYTGQNPSIFGSDGRPLQVMMHATSTDLLSWTKQPEDAYGAPAGYETADWRDPFVYRTSSDGPWQMICAARHMDGPDRRRGVVARCTSNDLKTWKPADPLWDPRRFVTQECPELFRLGEWWYLVYSEFTDAFVTRYRMARSPEGPWTAPARDTVDGRAFYAAKSAERDGRRFFFGWIATREDERDDGAWQWAGTLSALETVQNQDGTLAFRIPSEALATHSAPSEAALVSSEVVAPTSHGVSVGARELPSAFTARVDLEIAEGTREAGVLLRTDAEGERGYSLRLEPAAGRMVFDRWPRRATGTEQWQVSGDVPHFIELERPADLSGPRHRLEILVEGNILVAGLDGQVVLSTRLYDHERGRLGIFATDGSVRVRDLVLTTAPPTSTSFNGEEHEALPVPDTDRDRSRAAVPR